jgi:hypothetical protein
MNLPSQLIGGHIAVVTSRELRPLEALAALKASKLQRNSDAFHDG